MMAAPKRPLFSRITKQSRYGHLPRSSCALLASQRTICRVRTVAFSSLRLNASGGWPKKNVGTSLIEIVELYLTKEAA
jgi:hypothetical protein